MLIMYIVGSFRSDNEPCQPDDLGGNCFIIAKGEIVNGNIIISTCLPFKYEF